MSASGVTEQVWGFGLRSSVEDVLRPMWLGTAPPLHVRATAFS